MGNSLVVMVSHASWVAKVVILLLGVQSIIAWAIIVSRLAHLRTVNRQNRIFQDKYAQGPRLADLGDVDPGMERSPLAHLARMMAGEMQRIAECSRTYTNIKEWSLFFDHQLSMVQNRFESMISALSTKTEHGSYFLAIISSAPFIGLLLLPICLSCSSTKGRLTYVNIKFNSNADHIIGLTLCKDDGAISNHCVITDTCRGPESLYTINISETAVGFLKINGNFTSLFIQPGETLTVSWADDATKNKFSFDKHHSYIPYFNMFCNEAIYYPNERCLATSSTQYSEYALYVDSLVAIAAEKLDSMMHPNDGAVYTFCKSALKLRSIAFKQRFAFFHPDFHLSDFPTVFREVLDSVFRSDGLQKYPLSYLFLRDYAALTTGVGETEREDAAFFSQLSRELAPSTFGYFAANALWFLYNSTNDTEYVDPILKVLRDAKVDTAYIRYAESCRTYLEQEIRKVSQLGPGNCLVKAGIKAPSLRGIDCYGDSFNLASLRGHTIYVDFWTTRCVPCIYEIKHRIPVRSFLSDSNFTILNVSMDPDIDSSKWKQMIHQLPLVGSGNVNIRIPFRSDSLVWGVRSFPSHFVIDRVGLIRSTMPYPLDDNRIVAYLRWLQLEPTE